MWTKAVSANVAQINRQRKNETNPRTMTLKYARNQANESEAANEIFE